MVTAIIVIAAILAGSGGVILFLVGRNRDLKQNASESEQTAQAAVEHIGRVVELQEHQQQIREEAREEKTALENWPDADLVGRANSLFP